MVITAKMFLVVKKHSTTKESLMKDFYFPEEVYIKAHEAFLKQTDVDVNVACEYCMLHQDFFVEVVFAYVEGEPFPTMEFS